MLRYKIQLTKRKLSKNPDMRRVGYGCSYGAPRDYTAVANHAIRTVVGNNLTNLVNGLDVNSVAAAKL